MEKNKKKYMGIIIVAIVVLIIIVAIIINSSNKKVDTVPDWMKTEAKTKEEKEIANKLLKELEEKYKTKFNLVGVIYSGFLTEDNKDVEKVTGIYAYSEEYPEVYISNTIELYNEIYEKDYDYDKPHKDYYKQEVKAYKFKKYINEMATKEKINTNSLGIHIYTWYEKNPNAAGIEIIMNDKIKLDSIKTLFSKILKDKKKDKMTVKVFITKKGNKQQFEKLINNHPVFDNYISEEFGIYKEYILTVTKNGVTEELEYEGK